MAHEHHHHDHTVTSLNKAFILGIALNVAFVVVEFAVGLYYGSMGLLSDAGHNLSDVASLLLAMLAFRLAQAHATPRYTYGYKKSTVLISLLNSVILLVAVGVIVAESVGRMLHPAPVEGGAIAWTAGVGVVINGFTAWLFMKDKDKDLNVKGAYLHMAADALVSVGVLVSGVVISWTGWTIVDPVVGLVVAAVIVASVWSLTRDSLRLSLDGVPVGIRIDEVEKTMEAVPGVKAVHHIHVWAISTTENALTAHVVLAELPRMETVKKQLKAELETAGDPPCDARIRIFGRTLPRDVLLIARPAGRDCVPAFCGFLRFSALRGHVCCLKKQSDPERSDVFIVPGSICAFRALSSCGFRVPGRNRCLPTDGTVRAAGASATAPSTARIYAVLRGHIASRSA